MTAVTSEPTAVDAAKLQHYLQVRRRGVAWIVRHLNPDGSLGNAAEGYHFYRAPWTFAATGHSDAASTVCGWFRRHLRTPDGRIDGPLRVHQDAWAYRDSALIVGAQMAGQYDLSHGLMASQLAWQDPASGGFPNDRRPDGGQSDNMDIPYACGPGFAALATGHLAVARAVYRFLQAIYDAQTELPHRFYYAWSRSRQQLITDYTPQEQFWTVVENQVARTQRWTIGGIAAGFLCRLYLAEPRPEYLALARRYQAFSMESTERQFEFPQVCKSSWGSSLLFQITGETQYLNWTYRMGDWYAETQSADGSWQFGGYTTLGRQIELNLEFVMHVDTLIGGLAARSPSAQP